MVITTRHIICLHTSVVCSIEVECFLVVFVTNVSLALEYHRVDF